MVTGTWRERLVLLQVAAKGIRHSTGAAGGTICRGHSGKACLPRQRGRDHSDRRSGSRYSQRRRCGYHRNGAAGAEVMLSDFTGAEPEMPVRRSLDEGQYNRRQAGARFYAYYLASVLRKKLPSVQNKSR